MASHWPVMVGINQYQALQPLLFAQIDAIELKNFLVDEAGLPPQQCSLLTDISPMVYQGAAFPTRAVILQRLQQSCERARANDTVWFFFSGYGMHWQGQDYLLPIDGNPQRVAETGIAMTAVIDLLRRSPARQRLLLLDINRSQSALPHQRLGVTTMELAQQLDMPLMLSCRPNQFSQETLAMRHGLFTAAILEGLRFHGCVTLSQLAAYVTDRVPELCRHHFRPEQNPVTVLPSQHQFLLLVPSQAVPPLALATAPEATPPRPQPDPGIATSTLVESFPPPAGRDRLGGDVTAAVEPSPEGHPEVLRVPPAPSAPVPDSGAPLDPEAVAPQPAGAARWLRWLPLAAGMLLVGVLLRNQATFFGSRPAPPTLEAEAPGADAAAPLATDSAAVPAEDPAAAPLFPGTNGDSTVAPQVALEQARVALSQGQFGEALNWLNQIPPDQRPEDFAALQEQAQAGYDSTSRRGDEILNSARQIIEPLPASRFNDAIEAARQVPVGDDYYDQAQADITRWSQVILDLAQGRAANGNFEAAIEAANLVPQDQGAVYAQAQSQIQQWQQQQVNRQLLQEAQARLQPDQAASFEAAIKLAQQVPAGAPEFELAQTRINQWSEDILVIARARAADGQLPGAIAAAALVPPGTSAYDQAQAEIQRWQGQ